MNLPRVFTLVLPLAALLSCTPRVANYSVTAKSSAIPNPATEIRLLLGTRWEVANQFNDVFGATTVVSGTSTTVADITRKFVLEQPVSWGGSCDPNAGRYDEPRDVTWAVWPEPPVGYTPPPRACKDVKTSRESMLPGASSSRMAWTLRTCDYLASIDASLRNAVTNAGGSVAAINTPPTDEQIQGAYEMFYPGMTMPEEVKAALKNVVSTAASSYPNSPEAWRYLIVTLCSSPSWQIL